MLVAVVLVWSMAGDGGNCSDHGGDGGAGNDKVNVVYDMMTVMVQLLPGTTDEHLFGIAPHSATYCHSLFSKFDPKTRKTGKLQFSSVL